MALFGLFSDNRPSIQGLGSAFFFDGSIAEQHSIETRWTKEVIEDGSELTDNREILPRRFTITAIVSSAEPVFFDRQRHVKAWARLRALVTAQPAQVYEISTTLEGYPNMALISASVPVDAGTGSSITATIVAEEKQFASTQVAQNLAVAAQDGGLGEVDVGTEGFEAAT